ncbi:MAG: Ribonuclease 3 [Atribacteria bacterium 34_128]|nr:MAG: Ribonuclease 3 [Atribacteria bacterium 34_128]
MFRIWYGRGPNKIDLSELENKLGYKFKNAELLKQALTHTSFFNQKEKNKVNHFQRLEFLGDSVLNLAVSKYLYQKFPSSSEGELSKIKSIMVSQQSLVKYAQLIKLEDFVIIGKSVDLTQGRGKFSILADCLEACLGAIYLDGGFNFCKKIINRFINQEQTDLLNKREIRDYKTSLQEVTQKKFNCLPNYKIIKEEGSEHQKIFHIEVYIGGDVFGAGTGKNKKEAAQDAAYHALKRLEFF